MELTELLGDDADRTAHEMERFVRAVLRRSYGSNPFVRRYEDDIVQQVLTTCVEWADRVARGEKRVHNVQAWLARVTLNAKNLHWRRIGSSAKDEVSTEDRHIPTSDPVSQEDRVWLRRALQRLDEECRALLVRFHAFGESGAELAADLGLSEGNVRVKVHRCRKKLLSLHEDAALGAI